ncbi:DHS-like NAD/FAD-binding domain-containing protein [Scheffersomyces amazonensis]|uniref:DHS-like NAD/FAD-binding domain-containing protein n=1 Tax=Scheffersomyces amazonensis TaxID=1078765 RepID=UPI00315DCE74
MSLQFEYQSYISKHGIRSFLNKYIPNSITKLELCKLILDLDYDKKHVLNYDSRPIIEIAAILVNLLLEDIRYQKLTISDEKINQSPYSIRQFCNDLQSSKRILIVTGAGISTSLGIPDFRSIQGLYSQLSHLHFKDPQLVFDITEFKKNPEIFYSVAHLILPPSGKYSVLHGFIKLLQDKHSLLRNYTQNIDNLESYAGIKSDKLIQCHGSFGSATCLTCQNQFAGAKIFNHIKHKQVPRCSSCWKDTHEAPMNYGVIKPNITFFGEDLPQRFYKCIENDRKKCDLVIVIGTSLKVEPVGSIIDRTPRKVPRILINKEPLPQRDFNLTLLGSCDDIVSIICSLLGKEWHIPHENFKPTTDSSFVRHETLPSTYVIK